MLDPHHGALRRRFVGGGDHFIKIDSLTRQPLCPSRPGHQTLRNNFASSLLLRTCLPMTGRHVWMPTLFSLWRKARRENSADSRLLGTTSLRFALHG
ncbi:hypothetical protein [Thiolapillus sp.]|uniref:hypothetical protein n=1 Tax=Thiolapillus sp. TaxID=2017437 RepID=UPI003AF59E03